MDCELHFLRIYRQDWGFCWLSGFRRFRHKLDPRRYNGAVFLGLNGISVKSHGGTDAFGFSNAIGVAVHMLQQGFIPEVKSAIHKARYILNKGINDRDE